MARFGPNYLELGTSSLERECDEGFTIWCRLRVRRGTKDGLDAVAELYGAFVVHREDGAIVVPMGLSAPTYSYAHLRI